MRPCSSNFLRDAAEICRSRGALMIIDEIQTGAGRTGRFLASQAQPMSYDIVTLGKGLAGGLPVGATLVSAEVADNIYRGAHTSTFGGNPLTAAGILATLSLLDAARLAHITAMGEYFIERLNHLTLPAAHEVRGRGLMLGVEVTKPRDAVLKSLQKAGVLAIPAGEDVVRFLPPYIIEKHDVDTVVEELRKSLAEPDTPGGG